MIDERLLTPRQREAMCLRILGLTHGQIAYKLGITRPAVSQRLASARRRVVRLSEKIKST